MTRLNYNETDNSDVSSDDSDLLLHFDEQVNLVNLVHVKYDFNLFNSSNKTLINNDDNIKLLTLRVVQTD